MPALPNVSQINDIPANMDAPLRASSPKAVNQWAGASAPAASVQGHTAGRSAASVDLAAERVSDRRPAGSSGILRHLFGHRTGEELQ